MADDSTGVNTPFRRLHSCTATRSWAILPFVSPIPERQRLLKLVDIAFSKGELEILKGHAGFQRALAELLTVKDMERLCEVGEAALIARDDK